MSTPHGHESLSQALAHIVSGCYVLTVKDPQTGPQAILLSFVQQVGLTPPRIAIAIHKERSVVPALDRAGAFVLNVCAQGDTLLRTKFADPAVTPPAALRAVGAREVGPGLVLEPAAAHLVCGVAQRIDIGDHWLYIADARDGAAVGGRAPFVHVRRSGLSY